ncbi:MAG TPA: Holliday junction resolvase RuvX [Terriglobia bacterium]|nr:Holliday junction resolvase RuvX [Terriglobia bacterium]
MQPRILSIDFGLRRMGLAVSDALGLTAQGLPTLQRRSIRKDIESIRAVVHEYTVEKIVVGNPIGHTGKATSMSRHVEDFAKKLRGRVDCPVELWDERLTSVEANRMLKTAGLSISKRQQAVDRVSAVLLLQNYLDDHARQLRESETAGGKL